MPRLTRDQKKRLNDALLDAFDVQALENLLQLELDRSLQRIAGEKSNLEAAVLAVIMAAEREGWVGDLAIAAARVREGHAELQSLAAELGASERVAPRARNNLPAMYGRPLIGRDALLDDVARALGEPGREGIVVLHGEPGVGKSELAHEYARRNGDRYPGGAFTIVAAAAGPRPDLALIGQRYLGLHYGDGMGLRDQCLLTLERLAKDASLLVFDNVCDFKAVGDYLPRAGMPIHAVLTTLLFDWPAGWPDLPVPRLDEDAARVVVVSVARDAPAEADVAALVERAGGLPMELVPGAAALAKARQQGRRVRPRRADESARSFARAFELLDADGRLLLLAAAPLNPQRIPEAELRRHLEAAGWTHDRFDAAADACTGLHLLQGQDAMAMHQLLAGWLCEEARAVDAEALAAVRAAQAARLIVIASAVVENPVDAAGAALLAVYPAAPEAWEALGAPICIEDGEKVGEALAETGRFADALLWYRRSAAAKEIGNADGRIDHAGLGKSLHAIGEWLESLGDFALAQAQYERAAVEKCNGDPEGRVDHDRVGQSLRGVGFCLAEQGRFREAEFWHRRAAEEKTKGDHEGVIHHDSIGYSLHSVGYCLSQQGDYAAARPYYERAVQEKEQGDLHGRIDHDSLGSSLHLVGYCLHMEGRYADGLPWIERAVPEKRKGDIFGRVDGEGLAASLRAGAVLLRRLSRAEEAAAWDAEAVEVEGSG